MENLKSFVYRGTVGKIKFHSELNIFYGFLKLCNYIVTYYEGETRKEVEQNFHKAVDDYISKSYFNTLKVFPLREIYKPLMKNTLWN